MIRRDDDAFHLTTLAGEMRCGWLEGAELLLAAAVLSLAREVRRSELPAIVTQLLAPTLANIGLVVSRADEVRG